MNVTEVSYPAVARKPGVTLARAFQAERGESHIGVMYAHEPAAEDGSILIHISISKSAGGLPVRVTEGDVRFVQRLVISQGLKWPEQEERWNFEVGPFANLGVHVWQKE